MKTPQNQKTTPSAMTGGKSGPNANGPALRARIRAALDESRVQIPAIVTRLIREQVEFNRRAAHQASLAGELKGLISRLQDRAKSENWSERQLARKLGLSRSTWQRIRNLQINPGDWLPQLRNSTLL